MPERYKQLYGHESVSSHARIAQARGPDTVHLDFMPSTSSNEPELCVVALSSPGLLAAISTALVSQGIDVIRADVYARRTSSGDHETLALFGLHWIGEESSEVFDERHLSRLKARVLELMCSRALALRPQELSQTNHLQRGDAVASLRRVRGTRRNTVELHCKCRPGVLAAVTTALSKQGVLIVNARARSNGFHVHEYFEIEELSTDPPTHSSRLTQLLTAVVDAATTTIVGGACTLDSDLRLVLGHGSTALHCSGSSAASTDGLSSCVR